MVIFNEGLCRVAEQYLKKGAKVYIEGQLQTRKWTDQSGVEKYSTEVVLQGFNSTLTMLDGRSGGGGGPAANAPKGQSGDSPGTIRECLTKWAAGGTIPGMMIRPSDPSAKECAEHMKERNSGGNNNGGKGGRRGGGKGGPGGPGGPNGHPGYGNSAPHPATPGAKATPPAAPWYVHQSL